MDNLEFLKFYVADFDYDRDDYRQLSVSLPLESCRMFIANSRARNPEKEYVIIAVLDE